MGASGGIAMHVSYRSMAIAGALLASAVVAGCGSGKPATLGLTNVNGVVATPTTLGVATATLSEYKVAIPQTSLPAGQYEFTIDNAGTLPHEMLVFHTDLAPSALPMKDGDVDEEGAGVNLVSDGENIDPNGSQTRAIDLTTPGRYLFVCNLPGHFAAGMVQEVTVK